MFSKVIIAIFTTIGSVWEFHWFNLIISSSVNTLVLVILIEEKWYIIVILICIALDTNVVIFYWSFSFLFLWNVCVCLLSIFLLFFLIDLCKVLVFLDANPLLIIYIGNIFSPLCEAFYQSLYGIFCFWPDILNLSIFSIIVWAFYFYSFIFIAV